MRLGKCTSLGVLLQFGVALMEQVPDISFLSAMRVRPKLAPKQLFLLIGRLGYDNLGEQAFLKWIQDVGGQVLQVGCTRVMEFSLDLRQHALSEFRRIHAKFRYRFGGTEHVSKLPHTVMAALPICIHDTITLMEATFSALAMIVNYRKECLPWVVREPILILLHGWGLLHKGLLQILWSGFHYDTFGNAADHAQHPSESDVAYVASLLEQVDVLLETDFVSGSQYLYAYISQSVNPRSAAQSAPVNQIIVRDSNLDFSMRPARLAGCSNHGYEAWRQDVFQIWHLDHGLLGQLLRELVAENKPQEVVGMEPIITLADVCSGGGHYGAELNRTGLVKAMAYASDPGMDLGRVYKLDITSRPRAQYLADWILCIGAGTIVKPGFENEFLESIAASARTAVVMTWSSSIGCMTAPLPDHYGDNQMWRNQMATQLLVDNAGTNRLRAQATSQIAKKEALLFRRSPRYSTEQASSHETILSRCTSPSCHTGASDQTAMLHGHALHQQKHYGQQQLQINRKPQQDTHPPDKRRQINSNAQVALSKVLEGMVVPHIIAD